MVLSMCEKFLLVDSSDSDDSDVETVLVTFHQQSLVMTLTMKEHRDENRKRRRVSTVGHLCIPRNCHLGNEMLMQDYFTANPTYSLHLFRRSLVPRMDAGDILDGGIDAVESVVASINEVHGRSSNVISSEPIDMSSGKEQIRWEGANVDSRHNGGSEVVGDSNDTTAQNTPDASMREEGDAYGVVVNNSKGSCWT
ncbi:DNA-directed RNA polymerase 3, chloroplastic [Hordeum vulgare]|nr:DNA-directed RNA polymerase 3, chloroplastic [Hordeum vulgare]